jgi:hypothetical protein
MRAGVCVEMRWQSGDSVGVLHIPDYVSEMMKGTGYASVRSGEVLGLPIALGLGLILAAYTFTDFYLSGDDTAWIDHWGTLEKLDPRTQTLPH